MPTDQQQRETYLLRKRLGFDAIGWIRATLLHLAVITAFGILLPWQKGLEFFDPMMLTAYACLGAVFAAPAAAYRQDEPAPGTARAVLRILVSSAYGHLISWALLLSGIATVYLTHRNSVFFPPNLRTLGEGLGLGFAVALALSAASVWTSLRFSEQAARMVMRLIFVVLLVAFVRSGRRLPDQALELMWVSLGIAATILLLVHKAVTNRERDAA